VTGPEELAVRQARDPAWVGEFIATRDPDSGRLRVGFNQRGSAAEAAADAEARTGIRMEVFPTDTGWAFAPVVEPDSPLPCTWGDDAWHRAVTRLIRIHRPDYRRLLAEERANTSGEVDDPYDGLDGHPDPPDEV
jgi:hypothetical protein